ncbi:hypothetical protein DD881_13790, partial [Staphylococcus pseudintermedius]
AFTGAGFGAIRQLGLYFIVVLAALFIHFFVVYGGAVKFLSGRCLAFIHIFEPTRRTPIPFADFFLHKQ